MLSIPGMPNCTEIGLDELELTPRRFDWKDECSSLALVALAPQAGHKD